MSRKGNRHGTLSQLRLIKSIQTYEVTIASGSASNTQALSPTVNKNHAYAYFNGYRMGGSISINGTTDECAVELTNGSTVTVKTDTAHATLTRIASITVVEWWPWAATVQHGSVTMTGTTSATQALATAVDASRSAFIHTGQTATNANQNQSQHATRGTLQSDGSGVSVTRNANSNNATCYYAVIQFAPGVLKSRQQVSQTFSGTVQIMDAAISSVIQNNTIVFWGGYEENAFQDDIVGCFITSSTNLRFSGGRSISNNTRIASATVLEFKAKHVTQSAQQCGDQIASGVTTKDTTITAITASRTLVHRSGFFTANAAANNNNASLFPTSTTNVRQQRGPTTAVTVDTKGIALGLRL